MAVAELESEAVEVRPECSVSVAEPMKIASFNINDINRRLTNLLHWLREAEPDTVCLQELKATDTEFPAEAIRQAGYHAVWRGEKRWNGVAILAVGAGTDSHRVARRPR